MTGAEWAQEEHRTMLGLAIQARKACNPDCPCHSDDALDGELDLADCE
jgi:hypothetical protein